MTATTAAPTTTRTGSDFARLSRLVAGAGLQGRRPGYYAAKIALTVLISAPSR